MLKNDYIKSEIICSCGHNLFVVKNKFYETYNLVTNVAVPGKKVIMMDSLIFCDRCGEQLVLDKKEEDNNEGGIIQP